MFGSMNVWFFGLTFAFMFPNIRRYVYKYYLQNLHYFMQNVAAIYSFSVRRITTTSGCKSL